MGGCFSSSQEPGSTQAPAAPKGAKGAEAKNHAAAAVTVQTPSKPSVTSGQVPLGRVSMSSEKAAGNQEHARHSRANSRTSIASLGDVTLPPELKDGKTSDHPLTRHSEPGNVKPGGGGANASNTAGVLMDKPSAKTAMTQRLERGWD